jgi:hypothetical protein
LRATTWRLATLLAHPVHHVAKETIMINRCKGPCMALLAGAALVLVGTIARADVVTDWNTNAIAAMPTATPPIMARVMAAMHAAVHDAVNSVDPRYAPYRFAVPAPAAASKEAAAAAAAHTVLAGLVPAQRQAFDAQLATSLAAITDGHAKSDGIAVGKAVAEKMLAWRGADGFGAKASDNPGTAPGVWQRTPPAMAPGVLPQLGAVTPFVLESADQFPGRAAMPALAGAQYARDLDEIRSLGARNSNTRTAEQTAVAIFWSGNEVPILNAAARMLAQAKNLSVNENARLFALLHMAGADASVAAFKIKYTENAWRPVTAIRNGAGNAATSAESTWEPLLVTPSHPEYPSGHCIVTGAATQVLREFFGSDQIKFSHTAPHVLGTMRSFTSFTQIEKEMEDSRVWGGIHFRSTDEDSTALGRKIGAYAIASRLQAL